MGWAGSVIVIALTLGAASVEAFKEQEFKARTLDSMRRLSNHALKTPGPISSMKLNFHNDMHQFRSPPLFAPASIHGVIFRPCPMQLHSF